MPLVKNPQDHYVIDTKTVSNSYKGIDIEVLDPSMNEEYAEMLAEEKARTLHKRHPELPKRVSSRAACLHEDYMQEGCVKYKTEIDGLVFVPKENRDDAEKLLKDLQSRDADVKLSLLGCQFEEETAKKGKK